jgi:aryl-alcohol dehydrogenase-like predicted oxidoreductase
MNYRPLGRCGLKVATICLGTMQFGWTASEDDSRAVLDAYAEAGGNFIDTADVYSRWAEGNPGGVAEQIIGRWLKDRGNRDQMVIATKVRGTMGPGPNDVGLSRKHILDACEASLRRLQIDYIDLYQAHSDDPEVPLEETMEAFDNLVQRGLVRYIGASNYTAWRLMKALCISETNGFARFVSLQPYYNLVDRADFERELQPLCIEEGIGVIPYSPLAAGFLTGKYRPNQPPPPSARANTVQQRFMNERGWRILAAVEQVAQRHNATPTQIALAWILQRPAIVSPIIGANSPEQLHDILGALSVTLSEDDVRTLDEVSAWQEVPI